MVSETFPKLNLSIRGRIAFGFATVLVLLLIATLVSSAALSLVSSRFGDYALLRKRASRMERISLIVSELRRSTDLYASRAQASGKRKVRGKLEQLKSELEAAANTTSDSEISDIVTEMTQRVSTYEALFSEVVHDRELVRKILAEDIPAIVDQLNLKFETVITSLRPQINKDQIYELKSLWRRVYVAQQAELQYFLRLDTDKLRVSSESLDRVTRGLKRLYAELKYPGLMLLLDSLPEYENTVFRGVQATRSYLYFVNVLLASHSFELSRSSELLRISAEREASSILEENLNLLSNLLGNGWIFALITLALGLFSAMFISKRLSDPLRALTETFQTLSKGQSVDYVPGLDRRDEIGRLAGAANAFKVKNEETKKLFEESQRMAEELKKQKDALTYSNSQLDSFAYVASHDLKAPLRAIERLSAWAIEDAGGAIPEESLAHLNKISERVQRMQTLLDDLLNYSRVGRVKEEMKEVNTEELLDGIISLLDTRSSLNIVRKQKFPVISTSPIALEQVFLNLISNAIKYNDKETGIIELEVSEDDDWVNFKVSDNGPGIDPRFHDKVFEMYQRVSLDESIDGTGMGLAIVKKQVEVRGGTIRIKSQVGEGTTFSFTWPKKDGMPNG